MHVLPTSPPATTPLRPLSAAASLPRSSVPGERHAAWVRLSHWLVAAAFAALTVTGAVIFMSHPRLYWGETGNDLTAAWVELPVSRNYRHGGWTGPLPLGGGPQARVSAVRTYEIFNENGWARSLHFLAGWVLVAVGALYWIVGLATRHVPRHLVPGGPELTRRHLREELADHLRLRIPPPTGGPQYGLLQKLAYLGVAFVAFPLTLASGLAMSPALDAAYPWLAPLFGGSQSARTVHFGLAVALLVFLLGHVLLVARSGLAHHLRAMTLGR